MTPEQIIAALPSAERSLEMPAAVEDRIMERLRRQGIVETPAVCLGPDDLARVDRQAQEQGVSRDAMLTALVLSGLTVSEMAAREAPAVPLRPTDPMGERPSMQGPVSTPSPWLGWAILLLVGLVVGGGGWGLVRTLDGRARPALPAVTSTRGAMSVAPAPTPQPSAAPVPTPGPSAGTTASASTRRAAPPRPATTSEIRDPWGPGR